MMLPPARTRATANGDQELDPWAAKSLITVGRKQLGHDGGWGDIERWLADASSFDLDRIRDTVAADIEEAVNAARERQVQEIKDAGGVAGGIGYGAGARRVGPVSDMGFFIQPGSGAIMSSRENDVESAREAQRAQSLAAERAARQQENAAEAAQKEEARAGVAEYWRGRTPPGIET